VYPDRRGVLRFERSSRIPLPSALFECVSLCVYMGAFVVPVTRVGI
jgi:hypothetical protein